MEPFLQALFKTDNIAILMSVGFIGILFYLLLCEKKDNRELTKSLSSVNTTSAQVLQLIQVVHSELLRGKK